MTPDNAFSPDVLPLDAVRLVFEALFYLESSSEHRLGLLVVSKEVNHWLTPLLYRHIVFRRPNRRRVMERLMSEDFPNIKQYRTHYLQSILCSYGDPACFLKIVEEADNLHTLALSWVSFMGTSELTTLLALERPYLKRISVAITSESFPNIDLTAPLFRHLTHLYLVLHLQDDEVFPTEWESLSSITALTHFGLQVEDRWSRTVVSYPEISEIIVPHFPPSLLVAIFANEKPGREMISIKWLADHCDRRVVVVESEADRVGQHEFTSHMLEPTARALEVATVERHELASHVLERAARALDWGGVAVAADWRRTYPSVNIWQLAGEMQAHNHAWRVRRKQLGCFDRSRIAATHELGGQATSIAL